MPGSNVLNELDKYYLVSTAREQAYKNIESWRQRHQDNISTINGMNVSEVSKKSLAEMLVNLHHTPPSKFYRKAFGMPNTHEYMSGSSLHLEDRPNHLEVLEKLDRNNPEEYVKKATKAYVDENGALDARKEKAEAKIRAIIAKERSILKQEGRLNRAAEIVLTQLETQLKDMVKEEQEQYKLDLGKESNDLSKKIDAYTLEQDKRNKLSQEDKDALAILKKHPYVMNPDHPKAIDFDEFDLDDLNKPGKPGELLGKLLKNDQLKGYYNTPDGKVMQDGPFAISRNEFDTFVPGAKNVEMMYRATENGKPIGVNSIWMNEELKKLYTAGSPSNINKLLSDPENLGGFSLGFAIAGLIVRYRMNNAYNQVQKEERKLQLNESFGNDKKEAFMDFVQQHKIEKLSDFQKVLAADPSLKTQLKDMGIEVTSNNNIQIKDPPITIKDLKPFPPDGDEESSRPGITKKEALAENAKGVVRGEDKKFLQGLVNQARLRLDEQQTNTDREALTIRATR